MYSVVLLAALTAGTAEPSFFWGKHHGCHGWSSCHGCSGCSGCYGCYGHSSCQGCYGCYGGCHGCYGGCFGTVYSTCSCYGSCSGCYGPGYFGYYCFGGYTYSCYGSAHYEPMQVVPAQPPAAKPESVPSPKKEEPKKEVSTGDQAKLVVDVPEDAKLFIDDQLMKDGAPRRTFRTPQLEKNQTYYYILKVEVVRDGKTLSRTKRVILHAGDEVQESFAELSAPAKNEATAKAER